MIDDCGGRCGWVFLCVVNKTSHTVRRFPLSRSKRAQNCPSMPRLPSPRVHDHSNLGNFRAQNRPFRASVRWAACTPLPPHPLLLSAARYGVLRLCLGLLEAWKPPHLGGCTGEECPWNRHLGSRAQDTSIFLFRRRARRLHPKQVRMTQTRRQRVRCGVLRYSDRVPCVPDWPASRTDPDRGLLGAVRDQLGPSGAVFGPFLAPFGGSPLSISTAVAQSGGATRSRNPGPGRAPRGEPNPRVPDRGLSRFFCMTCSLLLLLLLLLLPASLFLLWGEVYTPLPLQLVLSSHP